MKPLIAYLNFNGNCRQAMTFYKECLRAELELVAFGGMPGMPFTQGSSFSVSIHLANLEESESLWKAFSQGAKIQQPLNDAPWGARFGMLTDPFGVQWMLNYEYSK